MVSIKATLTLGNYRFTTDSGYFSSSMDKQQGKTKSTTKEMYLCKMITSGIRIIKLNEIERVVGNKLDLSIRNSAEIRVLRGSKICLR